MFRVAVIGLGRVGAGFDAPADDAVRTHLKAIIREPRLTVAMLADADRERAERERARYGLDAPVVTPETALAGQVDAVCIATPDGTHLDLASRALAGPARVIVCEKPIEGNRAARAALIERARGRALVLNHSRRWIPALASWIDQARDGRFGAPRSAVVHYNRGFRHNGTHALDLIAAILAPEILSARSIAAPLNDFSDTDLTLSLLVGLRSAGIEMPLVMLAVDGRMQTAFSVDIRFDAARIVVEDRDGIRAELHRPRAVDYAGFAPELQGAECDVDNPPRLVAHLWTNVADFLQSGTPLRCAGAEGLVAYDLADAVAAKLGQESGLAA